MMREQLTPSWQMDQILFNSEDKTNAVAGSEFFPSPLPPSPSPFCFCSVSRKRTGIGRLCDGLGRSAAAVTVYRRLAEARVFIFVL